MRASLAAAFALLLCLAALPARAAEWALSSYAERALPGMPVVPPLLARPDGKAVIVAALADRIVALPFDGGEPLWEYRTPRPARRIVLSWDHLRLFFLLENGDSGGFETLTGKGASPASPLPKARAAASLPGGFAVLTDDGVRFFDPSRGDVRTVSSGKGERSLAALAARGGGAWLAVASEGSIALHRSRGDAFEPAGVWKGDLAAPGAIHLHYASEEDAAADLPRIAFAAPDRVRRLATGPGGLAELPDLERSAGAHAFVSWVAPEGSGLLSVSAAGLVAYSGDGKETFRFAGSFPPDTLPAFVYRYERPPLLALAVLPAGGELALLDPATGAPQATVAIDGRTLPSSVLAMPATLAAADGRDSLLLGAVRLDGIQFFKCSGGGPLVRAESAALLPNLHEALPEPADRASSFSIGKFLNVESAIRFYGAHRDKVHAGGAALLVLFAFVLHRRRSRRARALSPADLKSQVERLREMHEKSPENVEILLNLAMLLEKLGEPEPVIDCYKAIVRLRPAEEIYYEKILDLSPPHFPYVNEVAAIYRKKKKVKAGIAQYGERLARIEAAGGFDPAVARILARFLADERSPEAIPLLRRVLDLDASLLDEWRLLAEALEAAGENEAAMETLLRVIEMDKSPDGLKSVVRFGRLAHALGMTLEASEQFRFALETRKGAAEALTPAIEDLFDDALTRRDANALRLHAECLADARQRARDIAGALSVVERALSMIPKEPSLLRRRAFLLLEGGDRDGLLPAFEALFREHPEDPRVRIEYARILASSGRAKESFALGADSVRKGINPEKFVEVCAALALDEIRAGRAEEAARGLAALYAAGKSVHLLPPLAECHMRLGDLDRANEIYLGYLKSCPDDEKAKARHKYVATLLDERRLSEMKAAEAGDFSGDIELLIDGEMVKMRRAAEREKRQKVSPLEMKAAEAKLSMKKAEYRKAIPLLQEMLRLQEGRKEALATLLTLVTCFLKERLAAAACKVFDSFDFASYALSAREMNNVRYRAARLFEEYAEFRQAETVYAAILAEDVEFQDAAARLAAVRRSLQERERSMVSSAPVDDSEKTVIQQAKGEADYIDRRYTVGAKLGKGGMGVVFRCLDMEERRECAIKIPLVQFKDDRSLIERFEREASLMERLKHPNILEIFRVHRGELPYIVMEILDGGSLRDLLKERKFLPVPEVRDLAVQVCDALDYTHALKIVHRDIKPENVMIVAGNTAKVMDFGLAKAFEESSVTSVGTILGTYKYMAPEQCLGDAVDGRADIYALGVMFYEMLVGEPPFTSGDYVHQHLKVKPEPPTKRRAGIPYPVEAIVLKCLEKKPEHRYATAGDLKNDWLRIA